jgi:MFS family permease
MQRLAVGWLVLQATGSPFAVATVYSFNFMPNFFIGPFVGALMDRVNRKYLLMSVQALGSVTLFILAAAVFTGNDPIWLVYLLAGVFGVSVSINVPTLPTLVFDVVEPRDSLNANALRTIGQRAMGIGGAAAGGFLVNFVGVGSAILTSGILLGTSVLILSRMPYRRPEVSKKRGSVLGELYEGFRFFATSRSIGTLIIAAMVAEAFGFGALSLLPLFADVDMLNVGAQGLGFLQGAVGVGGGIAGLVLASFVRDKKRGLLLALAFICYGLFIGGFSRSDTFLLSLGLLLGFGMAAGVFDMNLVVLFQANVPKEMRGRVMGVWAWSLGMGPVGAIILGILGNIFGVREALGIGALILLVTSITVGFVVPYVRRLP